MSESGPPSSQDLAASDFYRLLAENAEDLVVHLTADQRFGWVSPGVLGLLGWRRDELIGTRVVELVHPEDLDAIKDFAHFAHSGTLGKRQLALRLKTQAGPYTWLSGTAHAVQTGTGQPMGVVIGFRDDNALVAARQGLEAERAQLAAAINTLMDPHVIMEAVRDTRGKIVDFIYRSANDAACTYNQMAREDLVGARLLDLLPGHQGSELFRSYAHTVDTGEPLFLENYVYPREIFDSPRHYDIHAAKIGDSLSYSWRAVTERIELIERYELLADNTLDVISLAGTDRVIRWISRSVSALYGWDPSEMVGRSIFEFISDDDHQRVHQHIAALTDTDSSEEDASSMTIRMLTRDGGARWTTISVRTVTDATTGERLRLSSLHDVQAEVEERQARRASEQRYRLLAENTSDIVAVSVPAGQIDWVSDSVRSVLGWEPGELAGKDFLELVHPEDASIVHAVRDELATGELQTMTIRISTAEAGWRWFVVSVHDVVDEDESHIRLASWRLADEEVRAKQALEASEHRYRLIAENASDVVFELDPDFRVTWASPSVEVVLGHKVDDLIGTDVAALAAPGDAEAMRLRREGVLQGRSAAEAPFRFVGASGQIVWLAVRATPVSDEHGEVTSVVTTWRECSREVAERAARLESEWRYRLIAENASDVVYQTDDETNIVWVSPSVQAVLGYEPTSLLGRPAIELIDEADRDRALAARSNIVARGQTSTLDLHYKTVDGGLQLMRARATGVGGASGPALVVAATSVLETSSI